MRAFAQDPTPVATRAPAPRKPCSHCPDVAPPVRQAVRAASGSRPADQAETAGIGHSFAQVRVHAEARPAVQAKLVVGRPGDRYEREADATADAVMRMPDPAVNESRSSGTATPPQAVGDGERPNVAARPMHREARQDHGAGPTRAADQDLTADSTRAAGTHELRRQPTDIVVEVPDEEDDAARPAVVQGKAEAGHAPEVPPGLEGRLSGLEGGGQPVPASLRAFFEPRLGHDLSPVRLHTDARAQEMARSVHARAFTLGRHIVFGPSYWAPATAEGRHLLAHELTHAVQQGAVTSAAGRSGVAPRLIAPSAPQLQKASCNFYVYDSTEPTWMRWAWKQVAKALALKAHGGYAVDSGDTIEEMLHRVLSVYATKDCDCIEEIQFISHGSSGNAMWISKSNDELTINDFAIPDLDKYGDGPRSSPEYQAWHANLTPRQRRLVLLRRVLCGPGAEVYYRSCEAFKGKRGQEFAKASATFWRSKVIGHTQVIALIQPGQKTLRPGEEPSWSETEGAGMQSPKKPIGVGAEHKPKKD
jgi:hypothetical protein